MPQRLYSVLTCQRAVVSPRNTPKNIKLACYSVYTTSLQHPYSFHTTSPQCLYSVHDASMARKKLLQRVSAATCTPQRSHDAHSVLTTRTAFSRRAQRSHDAHSVLTTRTAFSRRAQRSHENYSVLTLLF